MKVYGKHRLPGRLFVVEGIDGSGKSTQLALLQKWLEEEPAGQRNAGRRSLRLEALRSIVCPYVGDREWDEVLRQHWAVRWADQLRLANALACARAVAVVRKAPEAHALQEHNAMADERVHI